MEFFNLHNISLHHWVLHSTFSGVVLLHKNILHCTRGNDELAFDYSCLKIFSAFSKGDNSGVSRISDCETSPSASRIHDSSHARLLLNFLAAVFNRRHDQGMGGD